MTRSSTTQPVVPLVSDAPDRGALAGGLAFVEGVAAGWTRVELLAWIDQHLVAPGRMMSPTSVCEAVVGAIALDPATSAGGPKVAPLADLPKLLAMARSRVTVSLRAFIAAQSDDRFLKAAIYADRVQRVSSDRGGVWVARPREKDLLSDIVLSLFAVDMLMHREFHEKNLCICEMCGRVSYQPDVTSRGACIDHPVKSETRSGFQVSGATWKIDGGGNK